MQFNKVTSLTVLAISLITISCDKNSEPKEEIVKTCLSGNNKLVGCWIPESCEQDGADLTSWRKSVFNFKQAERVNVKNNFYDDSSCMVTNNNKTTGFQDANFGYEVGDSVILSGGNEGLSLSLKTSDGLVSIPISLHIDINGRLCFTDTISFRYDVVVYNPIKGGEINYNDCFVKYQD